MSEHCACLAWLDCKPCCIFVHIDTPPPCPLPPFSLVNYSLLFFEINSIFNSKIIVKNNIVIRDSNKMIDFD